MQKKEGSTYKKLNQEITMRLGKITKTNSSFHLKNYTFVASSTEANPSPEKIVNTLKNVN